MNRIVGPSGCLPIGKSTWWAWVAKGIAPKPVKLGAVSAWAVEDIRALIARLRQG